MKKLWQTTTTLHPLVERYTVGDDYLLDMRLIPYDIAGSLAHAHMLHRMRVLTRVEYTALKGGLKEIARLYQAGEFIISPEQEDCHTALEQWLTEHVGTAGQKIHTGRSRNDQILTVLRLYMRDELGTLTKQVHQLIAALKKRAERHANILMPGYTHTQRAMPTTVGTWLGSFTDALMDQLPFLSALGSLLDQSPLGSASGFGIRNFPLDRALTAKHMGFSRVQENPQYCGLSRGQFEYQFLSTFLPIMLNISRLVADLMLFTTAEFNFISLPHDMTTGSSIMPQKRNYDALEIMRGNGTRYCHETDAVRDIVRGLISGYHRDLQLTKKPLLSGIDILHDTLELLTVIVSRVHIHTPVVAAAMTPDLFVTEQVYERVLTGVPFRQAYQEVKEGLG